MSRIKVKIKNCDLTIIPEVAPESFGRINAFDVRVLCEPPYRGSDKELMVEVCRILTEQTKAKVELKTFYVVRDVHYVSEFWVEEISFQVITPLELQWHC